MKPLILSDAEVRAIKAGARQIRVPMVPQPEFNPSHWYEHPTEKWWTCGDNTGRTWQAPYAPGDLVPCEETWYCDHCFAGDYEQSGFDVTEESKRSAEREWMLDFYYRGDNPELTFEDGHPRWQHARIMPLWAVRHFLRITDRRPEKVSEITEADALLCWYQPESFPSRWPRSQYEISARGIAKVEWQARYPKHPWADNWCWVLNF